MARKPSAAALGLILLAAPAAAQLHVERAPEWEALFQRRSGWTGADGAISIPLNGDYAPGSGQSTPVLFTYGDTWVGDVDHNGVRQPGSTIVNNSYSVLAPLAGAPGPMKFLVARDASGAPRAVFLPETPHAQPGEWYWPADGFANRERNGDLYLFQVRLRGPGFHAVGTALVTLPVRGGRPQYGQSRQLETPLFHAAGAGRDAITFGNSVVVSTGWAQAPHPDGYLYVYGHEEGPAKRLLVCRILPADIEDASAWRFWDGAGWVPDLAASAPLFKDVTGGFYLDQLGDGRVLALYMDLAGHIQARFADGPTGPFGEARTLYRTPELDLSPDILTYNPIPHPQLSAPGELLIGYSVNSLDFGELLAHADWYTPKFIRVTL